MFRIPKCHSRPARLQRAFTLVEIAVVVMILGVLIALTLPGYRKVTLKSKATAAVNDVRIFAGAFSNASLQNGGWPVGGTGPGVIPPEMANALSVVFTQPSPIGGKYEWISNSTYKAAIGITLDGGSDLELLEVFDSLLDDGNTHTGNVLIVGTDIVYIIEEK